MWISGCWVRRNAGCAEVLTRVLASGAAKHLRTLDLAGNALGDLGIGKLVGVLRGGACPGLTRLSLRDNGFGADGAAFLAGLSAPTGRGGRRVFGPPWRRLTPPTRF